MSDVTAAVRKHIPRELVHKIVILRVSFTWHILGMTTAVSDD
jgi:hypothetical protein